MNKITNFLLIIGLFILLISCNKDTGIKDIDGNFYNTATFGNTTWMVDNLNVTRFSNGDEILEAKTDKEWTDAYKNNIPAWCYFDNDESNAEYGKIYNVHAIRDSRGLAPSNYKIPEFDDWLDLFESLAGISISNYNRPESIQECIDDYHRFEIFERAYRMFYAKSLKFDDGTQQIGFNGFPTGIRASGGYFSKRPTCWGCTTTDNENGLYEKSIYVNLAVDNVRPEMSIADVESRGEVWGVYVRCLKPTNTP